MHDDANKAFVSMKPFLEGFCDQFGESADLA